MRSRVLLCLAGVALAAPTRAAPPLPAATVARAQTPPCDLPPALRGALADLDAGRDLSLSAAARRARTRQRLAELHRQYPETGELWRRSIELEKGASADRRALQRLVESYRPRPNQESDAGAHLRHARALMGHDSRAAITALERALVLAPGHPDALAALVDIYRSRAFSDPKKANQRLDELAAACPGSARLARYRGRTERESLAGLLRAEIAAPLPGDPAALSALWDLDFKRRPPAEHAALRAEIAATTARIRAEVDLGAHPGYLATLRRGYHLTSDAAGKAWIEEEIVRRQPRGREAMTIEIGRWDRAHPAPPRESSPEGQAHQRALVTASAGWLARWPGDAWLWQRHLGALRNLESPGRPAVSRAVRQALAAQARHELFDQLTIPLAVARLQLQHRVAVGEAARRFEGAAATWRAWQARTRSDLAIPDARRLASAERDIDWQVWPTLAELHARNGRSAAAQAVLARMDAAIEAQKKETQGKSPPDVSGRSFTRHRTAGAVAEAQGRKREAVLAYRDALAAQWSAGLRDKARKLWTESGGDEAGWKALAIAEPAKGTESGTERWEKTSRGLPRLVLSDLTGKTWTSRDLAGKTLFVNMWATWCGPCKAELPQVKKLHERLAGRSDVLLLSLNVDDSVGDVEPFVREQEIGYPVLLANEYVSAMLKGYSIPRNWLVSPVGVMLRQQIGFDPAEADRWVDDALAQLNAVAP